MDTQRHFFMMTEIYNVMHGNEMQNQIKNPYLLKSIYRIAVLVRHNEWNILKTSALIHFSFVTNVPSSLDDDSTLNKVFSFPLFKSFLFHTTEGIIFSLVFSQLAGFLKIITTEIINRTILFPVMKTELFHCCNTTISGKLKQYDRFLLHFIGLLNNTSMKISS